MHRNGGIRSVLQAWHCCLFSWPYCGQETCPQAGVPEKIAMAGSIPTHWRTHGAARPPRPCTQWPECISGHFYFPPASLRSRPFISTPHFSFPDSFRKRMTQQRMVNDGNMNPF
ncbi:hypothetical protein CNY67_00205 [Desulfovibrio sp. G11]|nr:hypothetical protein CNY67_00205 [Desulfovibrio sp. G11]